MRKRDLFRMELGSYELTDDIDNYYYTLKIGTCDDGSRFYDIRERGSLSYNSIFLLEEYADWDDDGYIKYKNLTALSGVGGLRVHSDDTYSMLRELKIIPRGSFSIFLEKTS